MNLLLSTQPFLLTLAIPARRNPHATAMAPSSKAAVAFHPSKAAQQMNPLPRILIESLNNPIHVANGSRGLYNFDFPVRYADIAPGANVRVRIARSGSPQGFCGAEELAFQHERPPGGAYGEDSETTTLVLALQEAFEEDPEIGRGWTVDPAAAAEGSGLVLDEGERYLLPQCY